MTRFRTSLSICTAAFGLSLAAAPAQALYLVSYVSVTGDDGNPCFFPTTPCLTIGAALAKTESGGEIKCLDNYVDGGDYLDGGLTIDKPITIDCGASSFIYSLSGQNAITVNLNEATYPNGVVTLRNLNIDGLLGSALPPGSDAIRIIGGGAAVHIENVTIQGFIQQGIDFAPSSSVDLFVRNSVITNNAGGGVFIHPAAAASTRASLSNVNVDGNGAVGVLVTKSGGQVAAATLDNVHVARNPAAGVQANGASAQVHVENSLVTGNVVGVRGINGGQVVSYGNNMVRLNGNNGVFTSTLPLQ